MLGLALGSWEAGQRRGRAGFGARTGRPIYLYAAAEAIIGVERARRAAVVRCRCTGRFCRPAKSIRSGYLAYSGAGAGRRAAARLHRHGRDVSADAGVHPERRHRRRDIDSASCISATCLAPRWAPPSTPLMLVESFGFRRHLACAPRCQLLIAAASVWLGRGYPDRADVGRRLTAHGNAPRTSPRRARRNPPAGAVDSLRHRLFVDGHGGRSGRARSRRCSAPTCIRSPVCLFVYLWATWVGSWLYRRALAAGQSSRRQSSSRCSRSTSFLPIVAQRRALRLASRRCRAGSILPVLRPARVSDAGTDRSILATTTHARRKGLRR